MGEPGRGSHCGSGWPGPVPGWQPASPPGVVAVVEPVELPPLELGVPVDAPELDGPGAGVPPESASPRELPARGGAEGTVVVVVSAVAVEEGAGDGTVLEGEGVELVAPGTAVVGVDRSELAPQPANVKPAVASRHRRSVRKAARRTAT